MIGIALVLSEHRYVRYPDGCVPLSFLRHLLWRTDGGTEPLALTSFLHPHPMTSATSASGGREVAQTVSATGTAQVGNFLETANLGVVTIPAPGVSTEIGTSTEKTTTAAAETAATTQLEEKDARHAAKKINDEVDKRYRLSKRIVERDRDAIYDIAEEDPELATRLLKDIPDYEATTVEELLEKKELGNGNDALTKKVTRTSSEVRKLQEQLQEERILRLKETNPDLQDELETEFRTLYSDDRFSDKTPEQLLSIARALTGKLSPQQTTASDVAIDLLKQSEGVQTTVRGSTNSGKANTETDAQRAMRMQFGHSEEDMKKYLPENIDELLGA